MNTVFIDLGSHNGNTLEKAAKEFPDCRLYIGVEPVMSLLQISKERVSKQLKGKLVMYHGAAVPGSKCGNAAFYEDRTVYKLESSILPDKRVRRAGKINVPTIGIQKIFTDNLRQDDNVILKVDIEGAEYAILTDLMDSGLMKKYVKKLYAEWHWNMTKSISEDQHKSVVDRLKAMGYNITGNSENDQYYDGL